MMQNEKTPLEQTLELLEERVRYFSAHQISAENVLTPSQHQSIRSLSQILPQLCTFSINQTPVHMNLSDIYLGKDAQRIPLQNAGLKFLLPPVSDGQDSITEDDNFEPSFKWISNAIMDTTYLVTDKIQPKKAERGKIPPEWKGVTELLLYNVDRNIHIKSQIHKFQQVLKQRFQKFPWIKVRKVKQIYYKGKPSIILKFQDQISSSFAYFNLATSTQKDLIGSSCEIFRIIENKIKQKMASDVCLVFRKLPSSTTKQNFLAIFKTVKPSWMEELIEIEGFKYTICKVSYLQDAFQMVATFQSKGIKQAKVNYHPKSSKAWKLAQQNYLDTLNL